MNKQDIILMYIRDGKSKRSISRETGFARRKSTIITTNLSFDRWGEVFIDSVMAAAMTDRLTYKSYMVDMNGTSYRMKETKQWMKKGENK